MSKLAWGKIGERFYETGVDHTVLYPPSTAGVYGRGMAWDGITGITGSLSSAEPNNIYTDNIKHLVSVGAKDFGLIIEVYMYPSEWEEYDGSKEIAPGVVVRQQTRKVFGLSYRTKLGNDVDGQDHDYKLHLVYGGLAPPSGRGYQSVNGSLEPINPSWEVTTTLMGIPGFKPTARLTIVSTETGLAKPKALENILYGTRETEPRLPLPEKVIKLLASDITVTVAPESPSATLLGKKASGLQSDVIVGESTITDSLKSATGYTGFSSDPSEQRGYYLALKFDVTPIGAATTVKLVGNTREPVALDENENTVLLIKSNSQSTKVISTKDSSSVAEVYILTGLALES